MLKNGMLAYSKYDYTKTEPYSALIQAVNNIYRYILMESKSARDKYRSLIQKAVGKEGKLMTDVIPSLESIIGPQPNFSNTFGNEA